MAGSADTQVRLCSDAFGVTIDAGAVVSLRCTRDTYDTDYILAGARFGDLAARYRSGHGPWQSVVTVALAATHRFRVTTEGRSARATWTSETARGEGLSLSTEFALEGDALLWTIGLRNAGSVPLEVGDLAFPCPMNSAYDWDREITYNQRVIRHSLVCGHGSFLFWMRCNAIGPYLVMTPFPSTSLEYYDVEGRGYNAYIHSAGRRALLAEKGTQWRLPHTSLTLEPGSQRTYGFKLSWASDYEDVRQTLYRAGLFDVQIVPGMTVPAGLPARVAIRTRSSLASVAAEHPDQTEIRPLHSPLRNTNLYEVAFHRLGENLLTVRCDDGRYMALEFFVTEPVETLIKKRARFLVERQQHRDPTKWYDGLISDWNMRDRVLLSPDNLDKVPPGRRYMITCDDPGLCRAPFVAAKNVEYPDAREIEGLEHYISRFVWGGLQRSDQESYPYGIYGIHDWKTNRESPDDGPGGKRHLWRIYDYPHVILLYLSMYRIARDYPGLCKAVTAAEYLQRAYGTALAYFTYPLQLSNWSPYKTGTYNELVIEELLEELEVAARGDQARGLRRHWETKVQQFVTGQTNLFGSEYPFDTTGFESTHTFARYALQHAMKSGPGVSSEEAFAFLHRQIQLNIGCRGWLETAYYLYGSDIRGGGNAHYTLSYMSQMGGWAILDYALYWAEDPFPYLRLGYASILSSWALMNTGTPASDYGYWFPGPENDGGAGGGFEPAPYGTTWLGQPHRRGSWYYGCEIDLGFSGALRAAATVYAEDPLFGPIAYGGTWERRSGEAAVWPNDGVRRRFHVVRPGCRLHLLLSRDHYAADAPVCFRDDLSCVRFDLESCGAVEHTTAVRVSGLPDGIYGVLLDGQRLTALATSPRGELEFQVPVRQARPEIRIRRQ